jgi:hypothetical protein
MPDRTSSSLRLNTDSTRPRTAATSSFGALVHEGLAKHVTNVLQTFGLTAAGAEELLKGQAPSSMVDQRNAFFIQRAKEIESRMLSSITSISKTRHDMLKGIIDNMK